MKKYILAVLLAIPFIITACGTEKEADKQVSAETETQESETTEVKTTETENTETETEETVYEMNSDFVGIWTTGENEDTTVIQICEDSTWQVVNVDEIDGFEEIGGDVKAAEDSIELYNGDELYDTLYFGGDNILYSQKGYTYSPDDLAEVGIIDDFTGVWQTGENEDMSYLVIMDDETWKLLPADEVEGAEEFGGAAVLAEDSLALYNGDELYNTVFFGAEENTLYSSLEYEYVLVSKDYNEIGE